MFYESGTSSLSQAAGFCLLLHNTCRNKRNTAKGRDATENHVLIENLIQEERFDRQDRFCETRETCSWYTTETRNSQMPRGQSRGRALQSKYDLNIFSCLAQKPPSQTSGDLAVIKANQHKIKTKLKGHISFVPTSNIIATFFIDCQYVQNGWVWQSVTFQLEGQCHRQWYPVWRACTHRAS